MRYLKSLTRHVFLLLLVLPVFMVACSTETANESPATNVAPSITTTDIDGSTSVEATKLDELLNTTSADDVNADEEAGLVFMREEEKLARDVYIYLYAQHGQKVFDSISKSEQTHTDAILSLLIKYNIPDPVGNNAEGVFVNSDLQNLYDTLIAQGSASLIDGLLVGAAIEEIDILDIQHLVDELDGNADIATVYENLLKGSRNHLRAFVNNLENQGMVYQPQYLTQEVYDAIVNSDFETN